MRAAAMRRRAALASLAVLPLAPWLPAAAAARPRIVTTTGMIADLARAIGGEDVEVVQLMPSGVDPHLYKATRSDMATMLRADLVLYNGLLLEGKLTDALERVAASGRAVRAVTEAVDRALLLTPPGFEGTFDPHLWMDPRSWAATIDVVRDAMTALLPGAEAELAARAERHRAALLELDRYAEEVLATVPQPQRLLVTSHDAFNYLGRRYAFQVEGIQGLSTESEAGLRRIEELVDLLVLRRLPAVFAESTVPAKGVQALIDGAAARGHAVALGGTLFSDAMGPPGSYEGTYLGMIDHNVTTIARALGGSPPARGWSGKLAMAGG
jgi:manganese/zinc/iron transport system substrate-binding protein